ncbi:isoprenylcysteine carboxylmethyltransferase family protein [Chelativorans sp. M5D2P16]|uniref:methyltransferase family protein n=1 Tax=Chelativorans sp. M5D2P16 TaxID=3095678 RepID=UPI002ACA66DE|nr:isoprenylcysteine carboxylmethyltransferase family protein [Chelativorans sp. M5D2P16]MDZ5697364.1 isoprenylcysteine carboxylmethyltransferase family protein [Chelativorans sp. M5D2P16]
MESEGVRPLPSRSLDRFQRTRRLAILLMLVAAGAFLLFCSAPPPGGALHETVEITGLMLIAIAILGRLWCTLYIGGRKNTEIVARGPYSLTRNPLYVFSAIGATGVGAQTGSVTVALLFGMVTTLAFLVVIRREEGFLEATFGSAYDAYRARVPRFVPRFSGYEGAGLVTVDPSRLYATLFDGLVFLAAIPVFEGIEWLQESGALPVLVRLV